MRMLWTLFSKDQIPVRLMVESLETVFGNDEQITKEYSGLNTLFVSGGPMAVAEFMDLFRCAIQMGDQLLKLMLEKLVDCKEQARSNHLGQQSGISQNDVLSLAKTIIYDKDSQYI